MYVPKSFHTYYAQEAVLEFLEKGDTLSIPENDIPDVLKEKQPCFVSIYLPDGRLRGCMGTIIPQHETLLDEIIANAIHAAMNDERFPPLRREELEHVSFKVEVVGNPVPVKDIHELDPKKFGVILKGPQNKQGVLLPKCEGVDTIQQQLSSAAKKGDITLQEKDQVKIFKFEIEEFF